MQKQAYLKKVSKFLLAVLFASQVTVASGYKAFADTSDTSVQSSVSTDDLVKQVQDLLPKSATAYTQNVGSNDYKWVPVERYLANLKPTNDYEASVAKAVYQKTDSTVTTDVYPTSLTDLETTILGWTASGKDATSVNGVNLVQKLCAQPVNTKDTGLNAVIFDLIALDSKPYQVSDPNTNALRNQLIQEILQAQLPSGGWGWLTLEPDTSNNGSLSWQATVYDLKWNPIGYRAPNDQDFNTDLTGMALTALSPYIQNSDVSQAVNKAVNQLQSKGVTTNCSSLAQMIIGLSAVKVDPTNFNNTNLVQTLLSYSTPNGLFKYDLSSTVGDSFSTQDAISAMAAFLKFESQDSNTSIYYQMHGPGTLDDTNTTSQTTTDQGNQNNNSNQNQNNGSSNQNGGSTVSTIGKVTLSVTGYQGQILVPASPVDIQPNDNPYTVLLRMVGSDHVVTSGSGSSIYVKAIDGVSEFDHGPLSGWMYKVNGQFTNVGAASYPLKSGDVVEWIYTANGGSDVGDTGSENGGTSTVSSQPIPAAVKEAIQSLSLPVDNTKPVTQVNQTVVVQNADQRMTAEEVQALTQKLANNTVNLSQTISPNQDQLIRDSAQEVQLYVPQYAVSSPKTVSIQKAPAPADHKELLSPIYDFTPNGTHFDQPVTITIKVPLTLQDLTQVALVWLNESTNQWIPIPAVVNAQTGDVTGEVDHFTKFAVIDRSQLSSQAGIDQGAIDQAMQRASQQILKAGSLSDWSVFALARAGQTIPADYMDKVKELLNQNHGIFPNVTDYERLVFGVISAGGDPLNVDGYNLVESIYDHPQLTAQGSNGVIFALLALDSNHYQIPDSAVWNRDKLIRWILQNQNSDGGWALLSGDSSDLDLTSMALAALAPYQNRDDVKKATDAAVQWIVKSSSNQTVDSSESIAQEIEGLTAIGINPQDSKFNRGGKSLIEDLMQFQQQDGGFAHQVGEDSNSIATEQALEALCSYQYYLTGKGSIYQFSKEQNTEYIDSNQISSWALDRVNKARQLQLMQGINPTVPIFAPKQPITRAEFVKVIVSLLGKDAETGQDPVFADVQPGSWYYGYVKRAKELGIIKGVSETMFAPDQPITREQMAVMIAKAFNLTPINSTLPVVDRDQIDSYAVSAVQALYDRGIMVGDGKRMDPHGKSTREMVAVLAVKLYEAKWNQ
jgi:hypothetical protein